MAYTDYSDATGDDLQAAVRDLQEYLPKYWRWVELLDSEDLEPFSGAEMMARLRAVAGIIREFQRRHKDDPTAGWNVG